MTRSGMDAGHFAQQAPAREVEASGVLDLFAEMREKFPLPTPETDEEKALSEKFAAFHLAHPGVYDEIRRRALADRDAGETRIAVKWIIEQLRREWKKRAPDDAHQINNSFTSRYARLLLEDVPELRALIETRPLKSA